MTKTYLIGGQQTDVAGSVQHDMADAAERAAKSGVPLAATPKKPPFDFDLVARIAAITSEPMKEALLTSLTWSCDGFINGKLAGVLIDYYRSTHYNEETGEEVPAPWTTYAEFLSYVHALDDRGEIFEKMGLEHKDPRKEMQKLYSIRMEAHRMLADGKHHYETPSLEEFIANPRLRSVDSSTHLKWEQMAEDDANGDQEVKKELLQVYADKARAEALSSLAWDKQRAKLLVVLLAAFKLTDAERDLSYDDEAFEPFLQLEPDTQYRMMASAKVALDRFMAQAAKDKRVEVREFAKYRIERNAYLKDLDKAMANDRFDQLH